MRCSSQLKIVRAQCQTLLNAPDQGPSSMKQITVEEMSDKAGSYWYVGTKPSHKFQVVQEYPAVWVNSLNSWVAHRLHSYLCKRQCLDKTGWYAIKHQMFSIGQHSDCINQNKPVIPCECLRWEQTDDPPLPHQNDTLTEKTAPCSRVHGVRTPCGMWASFFHCMMILTNVSREIFNCTAARAGDVWIFL